MANDKVGASDEISFILNGKPFKPQPDFNMICPKCKVNRILFPCPNYGKGVEECPMISRTQ